MDIRIVAVIVASLLVTGIGGAPADDPDVGKATAEAAGCFECHGEKGVSADPQIPNLAGQKREYLVNQLTSFATSPEGGNDRLVKVHRFDPTMSAQVKKLSEEDIRNVAAYYSVLWCATGGKKTVTAVPNAAAQCVSCHGRNGMSEDPLVPNLAGQNRPYLEKQLRLLRDQARQVTGADAESARSHPQMGEIAFALSDAEIVELATHFSVQTCW